MIKFFYRSLIISFLISISLLSYLSLVGIETNKFNSKISNLIKNFNNDLDIDLKEVKIVLDPFNLKIKAKTIGSKLKIKGKVIEIENIKTIIDLRKRFKIEIGLSDHTPGHVTVLGAVALGVHSLIIVAYRFSASMLIGALDYVRIVWALAFGFFIFNETPDSTEFIGITMICISGLLSIVHMQKMKPTVINL